MYRKVWLWRSRTLARLVGLRWRGAGMLQPRTPVPLLQPWSAPVCRFRTYGMGGCSNHQPNLSIHSCGGLKHECGALYPVYKDFFFFLKQSHFYLRAISYQHAASAPPLTELIVLYTVSCFFIVCLFVLQYLTLINFPDSCSSQNQTSAHIPVNANKCAVWR